MTKGAKSIKRKVRVIIEKEIEIELTPAMFGGLSVDEYLDEFSRFFWHIGSIDDLVKHAAWCVARSDGHDGEEEGLGLLGRYDSQYPRVPDVKFKVIYEDTNEEIVEG